MTVDAGGRTFTFSQKDGQLKGVKVGSRIISLANGPRFIAAKRSDRSMDQFYNHDDKEAEKKKTQYTTPLKLYVKSIAAVPSGAIVHTA